MFELPYAEEGTKSRYLISFACAVTIRVLYGWADTS